jgi:hypothetical protein
MGIHFLHVCGSTQPLCSWQWLVAHLYTGNTVLNFCGNTFSIFTLLTVACSSTIHRLHFCISMSWWLMTHLSEFMSTSGTLTRCIYFSHILLTLVSKVFFIALHSQELRCSGCCLSSSCKCHGASPCETQIILGKASCFVFYMLWRNYILCGCNISRSPQMVNKLLLFLQAIFILMLHYVQWLVTTCLSFVYTPTDMGLVLQWSKWNFIKENMFFVYETKYYFEDATEVGCVVRILAGLPAILTEVFVVFSSPLGHILE